MTRYSCCDERRRNAVAAHAVLNGIDYLEVLDHDAPGGLHRQQTLLVRLLKPVPAGLTRENVQLSGGERVRDVAVDWIARADLPPAALVTPAEHAYLTALNQAEYVLVVRTASHGDHSSYRLRLQRSPSDSLVPKDFDPQLAELEFSFKVECDSDFDCKPRGACFEQPDDAPDINYLAKDYQSFRGLMLDRLMRLVPNFRARSAADQAVMLVELLAYAGDQLSYFQDAVATEAYLETARRRTSLRRHALLVDYTLDEGSNARCWVQLQLIAGLESAEIPLSGLRFLSEVPGLPGRIANDPFSRSYQQAFAAQPLVFEALDPQGQVEIAADTNVTLHAAHHELHFYTWSEGRCCLPRGATAATLSGHLSSLHVGDVLIFEEVLGPSTGEPSDADPTHRHAVRLTEVRCFDPDVAGAPLTDPLPASPPSITHVIWSKQDALPFPLCISARTDDLHGGLPIDNVSVARGNVILADHGRTLEEALAPLPAPRIGRARKPNDHCHPEPIARAPVRYRPALQLGPLTHTPIVRKGVARPEGVRVEALSFDPESPAADRVPLRESAVVPAITLRSETRIDNVTVSDAWSARNHLLASADDDRHFVVEMEHDGSARLRFGDGEHGQRPDGSGEFKARYRVGQGARGNLGSDSLAHVISDDAGLWRVRNPLPARGGRDPETPAQIRRRAPQAFLKQERAVTAEDYAAVAGRFHGVQRAAATPRWTGSWHTMFVTVDREGGTELDASERAELEAFVEPYRMAGHDLVFNDPIPVPLEIELLVCVAADYFRSEVREALLEVLSNRLLPDGRRGLFHPDAFTFGQPVYLSPLYAAARAVAGVETVQVTHFGRQGQSDDPQPLRQGVLKLARLEVAQLDNDRNFPERGVLRLSLHGGK